MGRGRPQWGQVEWHLLDVLDTDAVRRLIARCRPRAVFHCAGEAYAGSAWGHARETLELNVLSIHNVVEAIRHAGTRVRLLVPGSSMVYAPAASAIVEDHPVAPRSAYAVSKLAAEMLARRAADAGDCEAALMPRAFNHVGPGQAATFSTSGFAKQIALAEAGAAPAEIAVGNLEARRDITDVRDTVRAYRALMDRGVSGRIYNVCTGRAFAIGELLERLLSLTTVRVRVRVDSARLRPSDPHLVLGDPARLREEIGWAPEVPIEQTLADILEYWRAAIRPA